MKDTDYDQVDSWDFWDDSEILTKTEEETIWAKGDWRCACKEGVCPGDADSQIWRVRAS